MNRFAIPAFTAIAMMLVSAPTHGTEPFGRFSLLADPQARESCRLRSETAAADTEVRHGCVLLELPALANFSDLRPPLGSSIKQTETDGAARAGSGTGGYTLARNWSAAVAYHHELLFPTASNDELRARRFSLFSADQNRDVLDLHLSWRVSQLSELNVGYQVQSNRASIAAAAADSYSVRRFVSDADLDHAVTIGITRRFGSSD